VNTSTAYKRIVIRDIVDEAQNVKSFQLEYMDGSPLKYEPGQFITFIFPQNGKDEGDRRSYSFSTTPGIDAIPTITIKRIENGEYSRWFIDNARPGNTLLTIGASGHFTLPENLLEYKKLIFLAAGSGITPIYSLLKHALATYPHLSVVLIYSSQQANNTIFHKELTQLQERYSNRFTIEFLFSTSRNLSRARLGKWLLEILLKQYSGTDHHNTLFYLCGPYKYMRMATIVLQTEGVPANNIHKENFATRRPVQKNEPPDKDKHAVELRLNGNVYTFETEFPETILQHAKKLNIPIPYSCESGQCGTCAASCVKGKVWMWNNEVLVDAEVEKGRTLTCTAYAVGGDVILEIK
jgi:ring-1,2-phenylacetyl-CoA epoxidase subunit PaaE